MRRIHTRLVFDMSGYPDMRLVSEEGYDYDGPVAECKGASDAEKQLQRAQADLARQQAGLAAEQRADIPRQREVFEEERAFFQEQANFYRTLVSSYERQFEGQDAILKSLTETWTPILEAGPGQMGFTPEQQALLKTQATEETAKEYEKAKVAVNEAMASRGMGQEVLGSGADEVIRANIATAAAEDSSRKLQNIQLAGYERGYQNFLEATKALQSGAALYQPVGLGGVATGSAGTASAGLQGAGGVLLRGAETAYGAGEAASSATARAAEQAKTIREANKSGVWGAIGGILGGAANAFAGGFGSSAGAKFCWVAEAIYGSGTPEFLAARHFIADLWKGTTANVTRWFYIQFGERIASVVKRSSLLKRALKPLFDIAVRKGRHE